MVTELCNFCSFSILIKINLTLNIPLLNSIVCFNLNVKLSNDFETCFFFHLFLQFFFHRVFSSDFFSPFYSESQIKKKDVENGINAKILKKIMPYMSNKVVRNSINMQLQSALSHNSVAFTAIQLIAANPCLFLELLSSWSSWFLEFVSRYSFSLSILIIG